MTGNRRTALAVLVGTAAVEFGGLALGWWWVTVAVGLLVAVVAPGRAPVLALIVGTVLGWGGSLLWQSGSRLGETADMVGAIALQTRGTGWAVLVATLVYAVLLALAGAWLGGAGRRLVHARRTVPAQEETPAVSAVDSRDEESKTEEEQHV